MSLAAPTLLAHGSDDLKRQLLPRAITGEDTWCQLFSEPTQRVRPRRAVDPRRARRRRVGRQRPEAVEHERPPRRPRDAAGPHRLGRPQAPRHQLLRAADAPARRRGPPAAPDELPRLVQRGVPERRPGAGRQPRRQPGRRLAHRHDDAGPRAHVRHDAPPVVRRGRRPVRARRRRRRPRSTSRRTPGTRSGPGGPTSCRRSPSCRGAPTTRSSASRSPGSSPCSRAHEWTARRAQAARAAGGPPGSEGSLGKLAASEVAQASARTHCLIAGADGLLRGDSLLDGMVAEVLISVPAQSIAGGTDEIQHNIIGEKVLGLPREPSSTATSRSARSAADDDRRSRSPSSTSGRPARPLVPRRTSTATRATTTRLRARRAHGPAVPARHVRRQLRRPARARGAPRRQLAAATTFDA